MRQAFDPFSRSYAAARERFREAARAAAGVVESHVLPGQGPDGCELAVDVALVGARNPRRAVVVSSGLHGVEGFFGSAVQLAWLRRLRGGALSIPGGTLVVLPHAVNPFGFAWRRRANEDNVDLNRNFLDDGETYAGVPEHYDGVHDLLNPPTPPARLDAFRLRAAWAVRRHGLSVLQNAVATGQYEHPAGLFFGGREAAVSTRLVQERFWDWTRAAEEVVHLDLHTGLGAYADYRLLIEPPHVHDLGWYRSRFRSGAGRGGRRRYPVRRPRRDGRLAGASRRAAGLPLRVPGVRHVRHAARAGRLACGEPGAPPFRARRGGVPACEAGAGRVLLPGEWSLAPEGPRPGAGGHRTGACKRHADCQTGTSGRFARGAAGGPGSRIRHVGTIRTRHGGRAGKRRNAGSRSAAATCRERRRRRARKTRAPRRRPPMARGPSHPRSPGRRRS